MLKNTAFNNVNPAQTATLDMRNTFGKVVDRVILGLGGTTFTKAMVLAIRVKANTKLIWEATGLQLDGLQQYKGLLANANFLTIDFEEIRAKDMLEQYLGSLDTTQGIKNMIIEVDIGAATAPTLTAQFEYSTQRKQAKQGADLIGKLVRVTNPANATTSKMVIPFPFGANPSSVPLIKRMHHLVGSGTITINGGEVKQGGVTIWESTLAFNNYVLGEYGRVPQAGWLHMDFVQAGVFFDEILDTTKVDGINGIRLAIEVFLDVTVTVVGSIISLYELLDPLNSN